MAHVATIALTAMAPWPMKILVDNVLRHQPLPSALSGLPSGSRTLLTLTVCATAVLFLLGWLARLAGDWLGTMLTQRMNYDVAGDLFQAFLSLSIGHHRRRASGDALRRVMVDATTPSAVLSGLFLPLLSAALSLVTVFGVLLRLDAALLPYGLVAVPVMAWALLRYRQPMLETSTAQQDTDGRVYDRVERALTGIREIQAFQAEERTTSHFGQATGDALTATLDATRVQLRFKVAVGAATALATALILWAGAHQALRGQVSLGGILVFLAYLDSLYAPLHAMTYASSTLQGAAGSTSRLMEVLGTEPEVRDRPGARALPEARGHVVIRDLSFGYQESHPVLKDVSLEARPGQTVAIVGPSGAGKSTLVSMVPRFFDPWTGQVLLDGHDVRDLKLVDLRRAVSVVLQESFLFPVSIAENIAYGRPEATQEEIEAAARAANAHDFITALPEGYETVVGERGATLSGGERQRVAIARALLKDAPVLILDEPTAALDATTEHLLLEALSRLMAGRTTLIIAHRLSTIRNADQIVVLVDGQVAEAGSHAQLMKLASHYADMHDLQRGTRRRPRRSAARAGG